MHICIRKSHIDEPEFFRNINASRRQLTYSSCGNGNPIDDCRRCDPNWEQNRQHRADCAIGFGKEAIGGRNGRIYVVTDSGDDDPINPRPGTLRYAVIQDEPLWIIFKRDMVIELKQRLVMNSLKTIDGRGAGVHIANGPCITIHQVNNIIIHGVNIPDCKRAESGKIRDSPRHTGGGGSRTATVWRFSAGSTFGLTIAPCRIVATGSSTAKTISNNYMTHHNKVMLLGHSDSFTQDKSVQVTIAFNHFGEGLVQRMPR